MAFLESRYDSIDSQLEIDERILPKHSYVLRSHSNIRQRTKGRLKGHDSTTIGVLITLVFCALVTFISVIFLELSIDNIGSLTPRFFHLTVSDLGSEVQQVQPRRLTSRSWMSDIANSTSLSQISIPGSHNSLSYNRASHHVSLPSRTQKLDLADQLEAGVRFLDIRFRHHRDRFVAHHNREYLHQNFDDVVQGLCNFLQSETGRSEAIIIRLRREYPLDSRGHNSRSWYDTLRWYYDNHPPTACLKSIWSATGPNSSWPLLGDVRGKIVMIEDLSFPGPRTETPYHLPSSFHWRDYDTMEIQDDWRLLTLSAKKEKLAAVQTFFESHVMSREQQLKQHATLRSLLPQYQDRLLINFLSGSSCFAWPSTVARGPGGLNRRSQEWLCRGEGQNIGHLGVVAMDFVSDSDNLAAAVIGRNFGLIC
jgi:hypothetical protein